MRTLTTAGDVSSRTSMASHMYLVNASMEDEYFSSADGEILVVPQGGRLRFCTEVGVIDLEPREIAILLRGLVYRIEVLEGPARGFVCENYGMMGNIYGIHDAKPEGFVPGGMSLHNCILPHGPDKGAFEDGSNEPMVPAFQADTMSFMFETRFAQHLTPWTAATGQMQEDYIDCWGSLEKKFQGTPDVK